MIKAAFVLVLLLGSATLAQETMPRWKLEPGKTWRFRQTVKTLNEPKSGMIPQPATQIDTTYEFTQKVLKKDAEGLATVEVCFEKVKQEFKSRMESFGFDSEKPGDLERGKAHPHLKQAANMVGKSFTAVVDARGVVHSMTKTPGTDVLPLSRGELQQMLLQFPKQAISRGDAWTVTTEDDSTGLPVKADNTFTLRGVEGQPGERIAIMGSDLIITTYPEKAKESSARNLRMEDFKSSGTVRFGLDEGVLKSIEMNQEYVIKFASNASGQPANLIQTIKTENKLELLPGER